MALAGNKCDLIKREKKKELEAKKYAKEIGAIFQLTSAKQSIGIDFLFKKIINKFLDPDFDIESDELKFDEINKNGFKTPNKSLTKTFPIDETKLKKSSCILKKLC